MPPEDVKEQLIPKFSAGFPPEEIAWLQQRVEKAEKAHRSLCDLRNDIAPRLTITVLEKYQNAAQDISVNLVELRLELSRLAAAPKP
jgi:hypothetical protein